MNKELYTPVLKSTGERLKLQVKWIEETEYKDMRVARAYKGIIEDESGKRYKIYGKSCNLSNCACDAYAVEI